LTIDEELNQLDDSVRRLKIEYDIFFGGGAKKPPTELDWRVQALLKKYSDGRRLTYGQRYKFSAIQQKYAVFNSLWQQKLRIKEEGYRRPQDALLAIQAVQCKRASWNIRIVPAVREEENRTASEGIRLVSRRVCRRS
jgi:hypothetical protein